jgi:SOS response regulatory protein OraA/RecX
MNSRSTVGKYSRLQILSKLYEKGIPREVAANLVERHFRQDDELAAILKYIRVHKNKEKEKTVAGLLRKGFNYTSINKAYLQIECQDKES